MYIVNVVKDVNKRVQFNTIQQGARVVLLLFYRISNVKLGLDQSKSIVQLHIGQ
jgi:hypothetical protein